MGFKNLTTEQQIERWREQSRAEGSHVIPWDRINRGDWHAIGLIAQRLSAWAQEYARKRDPQALYAVDVKNIMMEIGVAHMHEPLMLMAMQFAPMELLIDDYAQILRHIDRPCGRLKDGYKLHFAQSSAARPGN